MTWARRNAHEDSAARWSFLVRPSAELVDASVAQTRFRGVLLAGFALIALVLAVVGVYAVVSFSVSRRTREIGVRVALGARRQEIVALILREGAWLTIAGIGLGFTASVFLLKTITSMLFDVQPHDTATFATVGALLAAASTAANYLPARRAANVDPMIANCDE